MHAYTQHIRLLLSSVTANPVHEHKLIDVFIQELADGPVRNHLFRLEFVTLKKAISAAEQEDFSMLHAHANSISYRPIRRQETKDPEPMKLCYVDSERPRSSNNNRLQKCSCCQKIGQYVYECSATSLVPNSSERSDLPVDRKRNGRRSDTFENCTAGWIVKKWSGSVGSERPTDLATST